MADTVSNQAVIPSVPLAESLLALVAQHGTGRSALLPVLIGLHAERHQITDEAMQLVAEHLSIAPVEVQGVVSFYHFLSNEPAGRHEIHVCRTISCALGGMSAVVRRMENETGVKMGETTPDGAVSIDWANCIGLCDQPPAILADRHAYGKVTPDEIAELIASFRS